MMARCEGVIFVSVRKHLICRWRSECAVMWCMLDRADEVRERDFRLVYIFYEVIKATSIKTGILYADRSACVFGIF